MTSYLDEAVPNGAFDDEDSELLWETCCRVSPQDPWKEWERLHSQHPCQDTVANAARLAQDQR